MNRNLRDEDRERRSAYADFDEYGNPRTGNPNSLSRYTPQNKFGSFGRNVEAQHPSQREQQSQPYASRSAIRSYGDLDRNEGASYRGGGPSQSRSAYSSDSRHRSGYSYEQGNRPESRKYSSNDYDNFINRNYGYSGRSSDAGYMNERQARGGSNVNQGYGQQFGDTGRESTGYDSGYSGFRNTGYGATGYNMLDEDRGRSTYRNRPDSGQSHRAADERRYGPQNPHSRDMDW